jgi:hypothetical protein
MGVGPLHGKLFVRRLWCFHSPHRTMIRWNSFRLFLRSILANPDSMLRSSTDHPHRFGLSRREFPRGGLRLAKCMNAILAVGAAHEPAAGGRNIADASASGVQPMGGSIGWGFRVGESVVRGAIQKEGRSAPWPSGRVCTRHAPVDRRAYSNRLLTPMLWGKQPHPANCSSGAPAGPEGRVELTRGYRCLFQVLPGVVPAATLAHQSHARCPRAE